MCKIHMYHMYVCNVYFYVYIYIYIYIYIHTHTEPVLGSAWA